MFGQVVHAVVVGFVCIFISGGSLEIARLIVGPTFSEHGLPMLIFPMGAISWVASHGKAKINLTFEITLVFTVILLAIILVNIASSILTLILFGVYIAF